MTKLNTRINSAITLFNSMDKSSTRTWLWSDLKDVKLNPTTKLPPVYNNIGHLGTTSGRLKNIAVALATPDVTIPDREDKIKELIKAIEWFIDNCYNTSIPLPNVYFNIGWATMEFTTPNTLADTMIVLEDYLSESLKTKILNTLDHFNPDPLYNRSSNGTAKMTGANICFKVTNYTVRALFKESPSMMQTALNTIRDTPNGGEDNIFNYVTSGDGMYEDGSFIQHDGHPYNGGYGMSYLQNIVDIMKLFSGTKYDFTADEYKKLKNIILKNFTPFMYDGQVMDMVMGRGIGNGPNNRHITGASFTRSILKLSNIFSGEDAKLMASIAKGWILSDKFRDHNAMEGDIYLYNLGKAIVNDASIPAYQRTQEYNQFGGMDRALLRTENFAFGVSMSSSRIFNFETGDKENKSGWFTGDGMTYLYNKDPNPFFPYWPTVNPMRIPGTTVDTLPRSYETTGGFKNEYASSKDWVGGSSLLDKYGTSGMWLDADKSTLEAKKSWFMFDDEVVALGAGINSSDNRTIETTVENRIISGENTLNVNGESKPTNFGWTEDMKGVNWINLGESSWVNGSGQPMTGAPIGYYFPGGTTVKAIRETRNGNWKNSSDSNSNTPVSANYMTMWLDHGLDPKDAKYSYVLLPDKNASQTESYTKNPNIEILANTASVQAVREKTLNVTGFNFWSPAVMDYVKASNPLSAMVMDDKKGKLDVSVSDPTQKQNEVILELGYNAKKVLSKDSTVTVVKMSPLVIKVATKESIGKSHAICVEYDAKSVLGKYTATLSAISPNLAQENVLEGFTKQIKIKKTMSDGSLIEADKGSFTFTSSNTKIASVSKTGIITGKNEGFARIKVDFTLNGVTKSTYVDVKVSKYAGKSVTVSVYEDTWIGNISAEADVVKGLDKTITVGKHFYKRLGLAKFDLSKVKGDVDSVTFSVYGNLNPRDVFPVTTIGVQKVSSDWNESTLTYNNAAGTDIRKAADLGASGIQIATADITKSTSWINFDVTNLVRKELENGSKYLTLAFTWPDRTMTSGLTGTIISKEGNPDLAPLLSITTNDTTKIVVDKTAPKFTVLKKDGKELKNGEKIKAGKLAFKIKATDDVSGVDSTIVKLDGKDYKSGSEVDFSKKIGKHSLSVKVSDKLGNTIEKEIVFNVTK